jgi:hypothetical protein
VNAILTRLGVPAELQAFFGVCELRFNYGNAVEYFDTGLHSVPVTTGLWLAGSTQSRDTIVTASAMEAIAFLTLNRHRFTALESIAFIAIGNLPHTGQVNWIKTNFHRSKFTLIFSKDLLGRLADIKVALGLADKEVQLQYTGQQIRVNCDGHSYEFSMDKLTLNAFEKSSGLRTGVRTIKPKMFDTFLDQLNHDANK